MTAQAIDLSAGSSLVTSLGDGVEATVPTIGAAVLTIAGIFIVLKAGLRWVRGQAK